MDRKSGCRRKFNPVSDFWQDRPATLTIPNHGDSAYGGHDPLLSVIRELRMMQSQFRIIELCLAVLRATEQDVVARDQNFFAMVKYQKQTLLRVDARLFGRRSRVRSGRGLVEREDG